MAMKGLPEIDARFRRRYGLIACKDWIFK